MSNQTNLYIGNVKFELQACAVTTTHLNTCHIELAYVVVVETTNAHSDGEADLREDIDGNTRVVVEAHGKVTTIGLCALVTLATPHRGGTALEEQLRLKDYTKDTTTVETDVVAMENRPGEALVDQAHIRESHILDVGNKAEVEIKTSYLAS